jgi:hypothetical protein
MLTNTVSQSWRTRHLLRARQRRLNSEIPTLTSRTAAKFDFSQLLKAAPWVHAEINDIGIQVAKETLTSMGKNAEEAHEINAWVSVISLHRSALWSALAQG